VTTVGDTQAVSPATDAELEADEPRRRRRRLVWPTLVGAVLIAASAGAWLWAGDASTEPVPDGAGPVATAVVELGMISATEEWEGTLDHGQPFTVTAGGGGTVTRLADQGETVERGDELYRLNEQPVTLLYGAVPMYRDLGPGQSGADAEQLEVNLESLRYEGVREWQADIGVAETGSVSLAAVVFLPEGGRVDSLHASVGDRVSPGAPVLDVTGDEQVVSLEADVDDRDRFDVDTEVTVVLPGGDEVAGTVAATAVVEVASEGPGGEGDTESVLQVEITVEEQAPDEFVGAPVDVVVAIDEREDVLLVPVSALLALAEGGYGLEVVGDEDTTSIVSVTTGLFADGKVQVDGDGIVEGTVVGVAGR
jgi:hypothetical protein